MMLGEESRSADYWKKCGDEALAHGVKGIIMMVRRPELCLHLLVYNDVHRVPTGIPKGTIGLRWQPILNHRRTP